ARGGCSNPISPFSALLRRLLIDVPGQTFEKRIADDLRVELGILAASVLAGIVHKKLALGDARGTEGVGLDDVRACLEKPAMDIANHFGLSQREKIAVVEEAFLRVVEALATNVG